LLFSFFKFWLYLASCSASVIEVVAG